MFEEIRRMIMYRYLEKREWVAKVNDDKIHDIVEQNKSKSIEEWDTTGIPCVHACAAIMHDRKKEVFEFVNPYYNKEYYKQAYAKVIIPIPYPNLWINSNEGNRGIETTEPSQTSLAGQGSGIGGASHTSLAGQETQHSGVRSSSDASRDTIGRGNRGATKVSGKRGRDRWAGQGAKTSGRIFSSEAGRGTWTTSSQSGSTITATQDASTSAGTLVQIEGHQTRFGDVLFCNQTSSVGVQIQRANGGSIMDDVTSL
ncbi:hypothetical protein ACH5RR_041774 [Cinchona calisaya]|uniref:Transposase n=1 Tax=Cinchona calisaya TaxID=153742 RepID=A0ABD2XXQ1_9GENT